MAIQGPEALILSTGSRIPYDETRDYVERVSENLSVYRQRLADEPPAPTPMSLLLARE